MKRHFANIDWKGFPCIQNPILTIKYFFHQIFRYICNDLTSQPAILHRHIVEANLTRSDGSFFKLEENGDGQPHFDLLTVQNRVGETSNSYVKVRFQKKLITVSKLCELLIC